MSSGSLSPVPSVPGCLAVLEGRDLLFLLPLVLGFPSSPFTSEVTVTSSR
jgi:hypothetical protein